MFTLRRAVEADQTTLYELLALVWNNDTSALSYYGKGKRLGVVIEVAQQIVAYGCLWTSQLHPTYAYLGIHVLSEWQGQGLEEMLFEHLHLETNQPLKIKLYSSQVALLKILEQLGFVESVVTYEPILDLTLGIDDKALGWKNQLLLRGYEILSMNQALRKYSLESLTKLHDEVYALAHRHDPATLGYLDSDDFLGEDLVPEWLFVACKDGQLAAVSSVRQDKPLPMLGWFGSAEKCKADAELLTLGLTALSLQAAARANVRIVTAELDSADSNALAILNNFNWKDDRKWLTFVNNS